VRVLIVDDEPVARLGLRRQIEKLPGLVCVGECGGHASAITAIVEQSPDVVLLDIQLGRSSAFGIIEEIGADAMPLVIFVTAYDRHAVKAFEVHALDYVLKPVDPDRLREALERAASALESKRRGRRVERLEGLVARERAPAGRAEAPERFVVRDGERLALLPTLDIDWFESAGNYVKVHTGAKAYLIRATMDRVVERLRTSGAFIRVRRAALINVRAVHTLERYGKGTYVLHLKSGAKVISSRYYQPALRRLLKGSAA
jgi:two-component system LytT family response regulator